MFENTFHSVKTYLNNFLQNQLKFERVKQAYNEKWNNLKINLFAEGYSDSFELCLNAFKNEGNLEIWLQKPNKAKFKIFKTYIFVNIRRI